MSTWSLADVWNKSLDTDRTREYIPRAHIWASELGGSYYDRYWKMHGRKPTTPPNTRAQRKFEAGNLTEWVIQQVLKRAGLYQDGQRHIVNAEGPMEVSGRCDFIAGGEPHSVDLSDLPESFGVIAQVALEKLSESIERGLDEQILEIKSCSALMFEQYVKAPSTNHGLQLFHYAHTLNMPGRLVYICRDDLRMADWSIASDSTAWKKLYDNDIRAMAHIHAVKEENIEHYTYMGIPVKEPLLVWDADTKKFKKNYKVEYSLYLTDYGYERPDQYAEPTSKLAGRINRVITRIIEGKSLTKNNELAIEDTGKFYPPAKEIIAKLQEVHQ